MTKELLIDYLAFLEKSDNIKYRSLAAKHFLDINKADEKTLCEIIKGRAAGYHKMTPEELTALTEEDLQNIAFDYALYHHPEKVNKASIKNLETVIMRIDRIARSGYLISIEATEKEQVADVKSALEEIAERQQKTLSFYDNGTPEIVRGYFSRPPRNK